MADEHRVHRMSQERWKAMRRPEDVKPVLVPLLRLETYNLTREEESLLCGIMQIQLC